jgi:hypothetical protein
MAYFEVVSNNFPGRTDENHKNPQTGQPILVVIQTENVLNSKQ